tara:strand:- start:538 stop:2421 length:1884 start_codon:yes stop_codon:yes gene_type:complete
MCGILGSISLRENNYFVKGLDDLKSRGPDQKGYYINLFNNFYIQLGFRRLSILDLSEKGNQPLKSRDGRYVLIFNGEIYNYIEIRKKLITFGYEFESDCDSEVLLRAWEKWKEKCIEKLEGMFSFAIYDKNEGYLNIVRDPFGIKPLYYYFNDEEFVFSSDIKPLLNLNKNLNYINEKTTLNYLLRGEYDKDKYTFFKNIYRLEPGEKIKLNLNIGVKLFINKDKWFKKKIISNKNYSFIRSAEEIRNKILDSVKMQLRSDVPLGFSLSGGIDSSSIVCCARFLDPSLEIRTFSYRPDSKGLDEYKWINLINNHVNSIPSFIGIEESDLKYQINELISAQTEPVGSPSFLAEFMVYKLAKEKGIKVMLDGHGADEMFAGYSGYPGPRAMNIFNQLKIFETMEFISNWAQGVGRNKKSGYKSLIKSIVEYSIIKDKVDELNFYYKLIRNRRFFKRINELSGHFKNQNFQRFNNTTPLTNKLINELTISSCPYQLRSADHSSMYRSIENRVPFLSKELFMETMNLPDKYFVSKEGISKYILRESMRGIVPDKILERRDKIGFATGNDINLKINQQEKKTFINNIGRIKFLDDASITKNIFSNGENNIKLTPFNWRIYNLINWAKENNLN